MNCHSCLREMPATNEGFCKRCLAELFGGKKIPFNLPYNSPHSEPSEVYTNLTKRMSISGVQVKYSMRLEGKAMLLSDKGGQYILKPIPLGQFKHLEQAPANEHLTMQIARQLFKISAPPNALMFFNDQSPAYLVKRFDLKNDGSKYQQEDFAQVAQITEETHGRNYKYDLSYEELGLLIRKHISMHAVEMEKFFKLILFNYVFSNGDAHVKNFSIIQTETGDYTLSPAYDLLCTRLHAPSEADLALTLLKDGFSEAYNAQGFYTYFDFIVLAKNLGLQPSRTMRIIENFKMENPAINKLVDSSFLANDLKEAYKHHYREKVKRLHMEWKS